MGVYIKGMEMPTSCRACMFSRTDIRNVDWCVMTEKDLPCECPLVPVPPHGRCIDADALLERFEKEEKAADEHGRDFSFSFKSGGENCTEWWPVQQMLMDAPTIIEAEEGE